MSEISLFLKHIEVFNKQKGQDETEADDDIVVILEDDAIFVDDFLNKLNQYIEEINQYDWDILFSGDCCNLHIDDGLSEEKHIYKIARSRGTCMYVLNKGVCKKLRDIISSETDIYKPIDHWFNYAITKYGLNSFWSEPALVSQGSEMGLFSSAIR
jgi:GR25 family glycosyltransferase involved in LPS biosynthesis